MVGAGRLPSLGRRVSRRGVLGLVGRLGLGVGGAAALGGVSEDSAKTIRATDMKEVAQDPTLPTSTSERRPLSEPLRVRFMTDHVSGPQGATMKWGLDLFYQWHPNIIVDVSWVNTTDRILSQYFRLKESSSAVSASSTDGLLQRFPDKPAPHLVSLSQRDFLRYRSWGVFPEINDELAKSVEFVPEYSYHIPDTYTDDRLDHSFPQSTELGYPYHVPQFGLPFELSISGFLANASLAESAGVQLPASEESWTWDDWTEWDARMTDPEIGTLGTWARDDYAGQYMPQMYSNGLKKPFDDGLTKTMFDQPEAVEAWTYLIDKVFERQTSPTVWESKELAGEFGNPFAAGKIGIWPADRVGSTGLEAPRIKDRFAWTLLPEVVAPRGGPPGHAWSMRANLVTVSAWLDGSIDGAMALALFLAGETFQRRVGMERGHLPVNRQAFEAPESEAPPPEGMKWLTVYADRPDNRSPYPFEGSTLWWRYHRELAKRGWSGRMSADESVAACQGWGERYFRFYYDGPKPFVREPVYP